MGKYKKLKPCPSCNQDDDLSIDSNGSMQISEVSCRACGYVFQSKCYEENIYKYWNKLKVKDNG